MFDEVDELALKEYESPFTEALLDWLEGRSDEEDSDSF